jgi:TRAP-type C4-dicarboxylate transport system permease large subunit
MIVPFLLFWVLLIWSIFDGDLTLQEAAVYATVWIVLLVCFLQFPAGVLWFVVPAVGLDILLIFKVFGGDIEIR